MLPRLLAAAALASTCLAARADTYQFAFTGAAEPNPYGIPVPPTETLSFQLSGPPTNVQIYEDPDLFEYRYLSVPVTSSNPAYQQLADIAQSSDAGEPNEDISLYSHGYDPYGFGYLHLPVSLYTGPVSNPTFLPGTYTAEFETHDTREGYQGTLTLTDLSTPATVTPEPSTLLLLGTGLAGLATTYRRRLLVSR